MIFLQWRLNNAEVYYTILNKFKKTVELPILNVKYVHFYCVISNINY